MIYSRKQAPCRYVSTYALIFRIISVYDRHPRQCLGVDMLQKAGLLLSERHGKWTYYRRNEEMLAALPDYFGHEIWKILIIGEKTIGI